MFGGEEDRDGQSDAPGRSSSRAATSRAVGCRSTIAGMTLRLMAQPIEGSVVDAD